MNLILDIGNTRIKAGLFKGNSMVDSTIVDLDSTQVIIEKFSPASSWTLGVSSVSIDAYEVMNSLPDFVFKMILSHDTPLPINVDYDTPQTLGLDRICGAAGAQLIFPNSNVLIVDIGTCITYDLVDSKGTFQGGGISPGFQMRLKAMNTFTKRLPEVKSEPNFPTIGKSTEESLLFGAGRGMLAEIQGIIDSFSTDYQSLKVILTGGDAPHFERHIENPIFAAPNLVLEGLNNIVLHNQGLHA